MRLLSALAALALWMPAMHEAGPLPERQLTHGPLPKDLDNNLNFSQDGRWLVFDCRDAGGIHTCDRLGRVNVETGEVHVFYGQKPPVLGVGAASWLTPTEVIAIHALDSGLPYDFTVRGGKVIPVDGRPPRWLDSRDVVPPFTPGALRGGTHKHEPDAAGEWVGFTYNDHIMKHERGSDLRNVGVSRRGIRVPVEADPRCFTGESFSVLLTACVDRPRPGSDEYSRAEGDCWVGPAGWTDSAGRRRRSRAFRATVAVEEDGRAVPYGEVYIVDVPDDITRPGPLGPLEGTATDYPKPPAGAVVRRLTRTAENPNARLRGVSGHLRASGDGRWITCVGRTLRAGVVEPQVFVVAPEGGALRQLSRAPGGVVGDPRFSPDGRFVVAARPDGSVSAFLTTQGEWGREVPLAPPGNSVPSSLVVSPDSRLVAYNREVAGVKQIFLCQAPAR